MLKHFIKVFFRNSKKHKSTFLINIVGLTTSLACVLLIFIWVSNELEMDKFHKNDARLYQVMHNIPGSDGILTLEGTQGLLASALAAEIPEVERAVAVMPSKTQSIIHVGDNYIKTKAQFAGDDYFNIFSFKLLHGDKNNVLTNTDAVVISDELALKLFRATENVVGKTLDCDFEDFSGTYLISGIFEKPPQNSTTQFDILYSYRRYYGEYESNLKNWSNSNPQTYLLLKKSASIDLLNNKIRNFINTKHESSTHTLFATKYSDKYLYNTFENGAQTGGRISYIRLFLIMALFILIIACINFMNLSTARASTRMKEIGIKKTMGARRNTLVFQYMSESMIMAFLSVALAFVIVLLVLPRFGEIMGRQLALNFGSKGILSILGVTIFTGLLAGSYPALYLTGFGPIAILKNKFKSFSGTSWIRKGLVIFQFSLSILFIVSVLIIYNQMRLIQNKKLGYNRDNVIYFERLGNLKDNLEVFLTELKRIPGVVNASAMKSDFTGDYGSFGKLDWPGKDPENKIQFWRRNVDYDFIETLGIELVQGRTYSKQYGSEETNLIINEAAAKVMGLQDPIGKTIKFFGEDRQIVGVVKDFHFQSLYEPLKPLVLTRMSFSDRVLVRLKPGMEKETLSRIENLFKDFNPGLSFDFKFFDDDYQTLYASENRITSLSEYLAFLAIIISSLGLLGLAMFTAERRKKEISIRKVLGQSAVQVTAMLSGEFAKLVLIAILIAIPIAYILANNWLSNFAYRIPLQAWYFIGAGFIALLIAMISVSFQAIKAAIANPVKSLRTE